MRYFKMLLLALAALAAPVLVTAADTGTDRSDRSSGSTSGYRAGEDWNDWAARQGWWGRGSNDNRHMVEPGEGADYY